MAIYSPFLYATVARSKMSTEYEYVVRDGLVVKRIDFSHFRNRGKCYFDFFSYLN